MSIKSDIVTTNEISADKIVEVEMSTVGELIPTKPANENGFKAWFTLDRRRWLYGIAIAVIPIAVSYQIIHPDQATSLIALAAALLGVSGMALGNPTKDK